VHFRDRDERGNRRRSEVGPLARRLASAVRLTRLAIAAPAAATPTSLPALALLSGLLA